MHLQYRHVPTKLNPTDVLSRGCNIQQLSKNDLWLHGPVDLMLNPNENVEVSRVCVYEIIQEIHPHPALVSVVDLSKFSSYNKVCAVVKLIFQFGKSNKSPLKALAYQEQRQHTPSLYDYVYNTHTPVTADIKTTATQLNLVIINNVMRCIGCIQRSDLKQETHTPLFLPRKSHLIKLLILHLHEKHKHCSVTQTMTYFRQHFWTPQLRPVIASILRACVTCKCVRSRTIPCPPLPPLPDVRVQYDKPFQCVGVDNTGSFNVRGCIETMRYITIFVYTATRNIHLEVSPSLSFVDFLNVLRGFSALYVTPAVILNDNGRNFVGASKCLGSLREEEDVRYHLHQHNIKWKFQTPRSPWKVGHFERLISTVKSCLNVSLQNKALTEEEFRTVVAECQAVVNNRLLTYLSNDVQDEPLTPSHLLRGTIVETLPLISAAEPREDDDVNVRRRVRHQYVLFMQALKTFEPLEEYLMPLQQGHYNGCSKQQGHHLRKGELGLLQYPGSAKYNWQLAKVVKVYPDNRGIVRSVNSAIKEKNM